MKLRFQDGFEIEKASSEGWVMFLYRNHPTRLAEYCDHLARHNAAFRYIDHFLRRP